MQMPKRFASTNNSPQNNAAANNEQLFVEKPFRKPQNPPPPANPNELFQLLPPPIPAATGPGIEPQTMIIPFSTGHYNLRRNRPHVSAVKRKNRKYYDPLPLREHKARLTCIARKNLPPSLLQQHLTKAHNIALEIMEFQRKKGSPPPSTSCNVDAIVTERVDNFGLPIFSPGENEPAWVIKRRNFLKTLSVTERNLLLTGDPYFQFDPLVYDCIFNLPAFATPPFLHHHFQYLNPQIIVNDDVIAQPEADLLPQINFDLPQIVEPAIPLMQDQFNDPMTSSSSSDSDYQECGAQSLTPPLPFVSPPKSTRSGRLYGPLDVHPPSPNSSSGASSSFFSRAARTVGKLMDNHPISNPRADPKRKKDG